MSFADNKPRNVQYIRGTERPITVAVACVAGDLLTYNAQWELAIEGTATECVVALEDCEAGKEVNAVPFALITSFSGATPGGPVCNAAAGAYQEVTGTKVGIMVSATAGYILPLLVPATAP